MNLCKVSFPILFSWFWSEMFSWGSPEYELIRKMCPQWKTLVMILPRTFMCVCVCMSECTVCPMYLSMSSYLSLPEELCSCQSVPRCHKVVPCSDSRAAHRTVSLPSAPEGFYDAAWPLRHSRRKHCAGFHQSPLWHRQMVQSSTFTSMPAGMIVVPAKQFGPVTWGKGGDFKEAGMNESLQEPLLGGNAGVTHGSYEGGTDVWMFFTAMHRWACFCNTKALLLLSFPFSLILPLTHPSSHWDALHSNVPQAAGDAEQSCWHYVWSEHAPLILFYCGLQAL